MFLVVIICAITIDSIGDISVVAIIITTVIIAVIFNLYVQL